MRDERVGNGGVVGSCVVAEPAALGEEGAVEEGRVVRSAEGGVRVGRGEFEVAEEGRLGDGAVEAVGVLTSAHSL
jgi:hypothetical protein